MAYPHYNPDTQKLVDLLQQTRESRHWARIFCKDGYVFEGYADTITWIEDPEDEDKDLDALHFFMRDGTGCTFAGVQIDHFEILEPR